HHINDNQVWGFPLCHGQARVPIRCRDNPITPSFQECAESAEDVCVIVYKQNRLLGSHESIVALRFAILDQSLPGSWAARQPYPYISEERGAVHGPWGDFCRRYQEAQLSIFSTQTVGPPRNSAITCRRSGKRMKRLGLLGHTNARIGRASFRPSLGCTRKSSASC